MEGCQICCHRVGDSLLWFGSHVREYVTVEPVMLLYMLGSYLQYNALIQLLYFKLCLIKYNDTEACNNLGDHKDMEDYVQTTASNWIIIINAFLTVASILSTIAFGAWSDRVGRRITILLPTIGSVLNGITLIFCSVYKLSSPWYIVLGTTIMGIFGSFPTLTTAVFSYMGDVTSRDNRTMRFSILEAMTFSGSFIGLVSGGVVIDNFGYVAAFIYYISCNVAVILYTLLWLRESVSISSPSDDMDGRVLVDDVDSQVETELGSPTSSPRSVCRELCRFENVRSALRVLVKKRPNYGRLQIVLLVGCLFTLQLVGEGFSDTIVLYLKREPREFSASLIGYFQGLKGGLAALTLLIGMPLLRLAPIRDTLIAVVAMLFRAAASVMLSLSQVTVAVFLATILYAPSGIPAAVTRALLSKTVDHTEQGGLFSLTGALETMTTFLSSAIFNALYGATTSLLTGGFVFIVMAGLLIIPMLLMLWVRDLQKDQALYRQPILSASPSSNNDLDI